MNVNATNRLGRTALMAAVDRGSAEAVQLLMGHGASTEVIDQAGDTAEDCCEGIEDETVQEEVLALLLEVPGAAQIVARRRERMVSEARACPRGRQYQECDVEGAPDCGCRGEPAREPATPSQVMGMYGAL